jgi:DegV family protein with EDD domain
MSRISIVTDSTSDIPKQMLTDLDITVVPLKISFGDAEFREGIDITPNEFYAKLKTFNGFPRTSQPSPADFAACYKELGKNGADHVISIHLSSRLSGTFQSAIMAKEMVDIPVDVIDSKGASMMIGFMVLEAAKAAKQGKDSVFILNKINEMIEKIKVYFVVDTLEYLQKGGRIGKASAFLGNLLNIKPMLSIQDGLVVPVEKIRGKARVIEKLIEKVKKDEKEGPLKGVIVHADAEELAVSYVEKIRGECNFSELSISTIGAVIGTYTGPGAIGIIYY